MQIVDDIIETGLTLNKLVNTIRSLNVRNVWTCLLLSKRVKRSVDYVQENFVAFNIPNKFIVGYGLDYNQSFRDLNHLCVISENGIKNN